MKFPHIVIQDYRKRVNDGVLTPVPNAIFKTDLATPYVGLSQDPTAPTTVPPPVESDQTVQHIAEILIAGYTLDIAARKLAAVVPGIPVEIFKATLQNSGGTKGHAARARADALETKTAAHREIFYRAAYVKNAAQRIHDDVSNGVPLDQALKSEKEVFRSHEAARSMRKLSAERVSVAAERFGPLLGWYLNPLLNNERECITANDHNFYAEEGTVIGLPGSVHRGCGCTAGPPHAGATLVNEALAADREVIFQQPKRYRTKAS